MIVLFLVRFVSERQVPWCDGGFLSYAPAFSTNPGTQRCTTPFNRQWLARQVITLLDTPLDIEDRPGAEDLPLVKGEVRLEHVSFRYRPDTPLVLQDVSLEIAPGKTIALVGPTGAGKTTIASLAARFYEVTEGAIYIDGRDIRNVTQSSLHRQVRWSPGPVLFSRSNADNIRYCMPELPGEVEEAAAQANAILCLPAAGVQYTRVEGGVNLPRAAPAGQHRPGLLQSAILTSTRLP